LTLTRVNSPVNLSLTARVASLTSIVAIWRLIEEIAAGVKHPVTGRNAAEKRAIYARFLR